MVVTLPSAGGRSPAIPGVVVTLPGPPRRLPRPRPRLPRSPKTALPRIPPASDDQPPVLRRAAAPVSPAGFDSDSALFFQTMIGQWTEADAQALLGEPTRQRLALGEDESETGLILAFAEPHRPL